MVICGHANKAAIINSSEFVELQRRIPTGVPGHFRILIFYRVEELKNEEAGKKI